MVIDRLLSAIRRMRDDEHGNLLLEAAAVITLLFSIVLGTVNFGMAYSRLMDLTNAVRAGTQFALVRKPSLNNDNSGLSTLDDVRNAVVDAAPFRTADDPPPVVTLFCECPDGSPSVCTSSGGGAITCPGGGERRAFLSISLSQEYELLFPMPGVGRTVTLNRDDTIRLN